MGRYHRTVPPWREQVLPGPGEGPGPDPDGPHGCANPDCSAIPMIQDEDTGRYRMLREDEEELCTGCRKDIRAAEQEQNRKERIKELDQA